VIQIAQSQELTLSYEAAVIQPQTYALSRCRGS
jgi:hypothetical protein